MKRFLSWLRSLFTDSSDTFLPIDELIATIKRDHYE
jgi:hypothetical protein